jgi:hypothetical protein
MTAVDTWFHSPDRLAALSCACNRWLGTPFSGNGATVGVGVSCQKLVGAIYEETGFADDLAVPAIPMNFWKFARPEDSLVLAYMKTRRDFKVIPLDRDLVLPGDLLSFRLGRVIHHIGIATWFPAPGCFMHSVEGAGAVFASLSDATWKTRFAQMWRPVKIYSAIQ